MMQCKMWWNDVMRCDALYIPHLTTTVQQFSQHTIPHLTPHHTFSTDHTSHGMVWNLVWCGMFCSARCGLLCLIHPNVAVMWKKVRCRTCAMQNVMSCNVRWGVKCGDAIWNDGVVHGEYGCVLQDVKCGCGIPSDVEWFDAILNMVWCGMMVEMQCGMCAVVWNVLWDSVMCNLYLKVVMCMVCSGMWVWCGIVCRDVIWNVVQCGMLQFQTWCDVECDWNAKCVMWNMVWCGIRCPGMWNVA